MKVKNVQPEEVVPWAIHGLKVGIVVGKAKSLFTHNTIHFTEFWMQLGVCFLLAVLIRYLVTPTNQLSVI